MPHQIAKKLIPPEGLSIAASPGNSIQRVHLDLSHDGISLAMVGAASAALTSGNQHVVQLKHANDGISLAMVGAASAAKQ